MFETLFAAIKCNEHTRSEEDYLIIISKLALIKSHLGFLEEIS
jgi:hypothetical protein